MREHGIFDLMRNSSENYDDYNRKKSDFFDSFTDGDYDQLLKCFKAVSPSLHTREEAEAKAEKSALNRYPIIPNLGPVESDIDSSKRYIAKMFFMACYDWLLSNVGSGDGIYTHDDMMGIAGWMAAADNKRPIHELKEEAEEYIKKLNEKRNLPSPPKQ